MEDTAEQKLDEKKGTDSNEKADKGMPSKRQLDHLAYARQMKKLKQQKRDQEVDAQSQHLDFIYKRLTNIEKSVGDIRESTSFNKLKRKRSSRKEEDDDDDDEKLTLAHNVPEKKKCVEKNTTMTDNLVYYSGKAAVMIAGSVILSLIKQYATARNTSDGDTIGGYYVG